MIQFTDAERHSAIVPFSQRCYGAILQDLEGLASYLTNLGLRGAPNDRLRGLIADIRTLEKARSEGRLQALEAQPAGLVWSLVEGEESPRSSRVLPATIQRS